MVPAHLSPIRSSSHRWTHRRSLAAMAPREMTFDTECSRGWALAYRWAMDCDYGGWTMAMANDERAIACAVPSWSLPMHSLDEHLYLVPSMTSSSSSPPMLSRPRCFRQYRATHWTLCSACTLNSTLIASSLLYRSIFATDLVADVPHHHHHCWMCNSLYRRYWPLWILSLFYHRPLPHCRCQYHWSPHTAALSPTFYQNLWICVQSAIWRRIYSLYAYWSRAVPKRFGCLLLVLLLLRTQPLLLSPALRGGLSVKWWRFRILFYSAGANIECARFLLERN